MCWSYAKPLTKNLKLHSSLNESIKHSFLEHVRFIAKPILAAINKTLLLSRQVVCMRLTTDHELLFLFSDISFAAALCKP